jgi:hypothetical protein
MPRVARLLPGVSANLAKIALMAGKKWQPKRTLSIGFLDGSATQRQRVIRHAREWIRYESVSLDFTGGASADIRISFQHDDSSWSAVGTDCFLQELFPKGEPTVNLGWLKDDTDDVEYRRVVLHEFGHVLGAIHEHQNPSKNPIRWNVQAVYQVFSGPPNNWSEADIDYNILHRYSVDQLNGTKFDIKSIMLYQFPPELIMGGHETPFNTLLSAGDKRFIGRMYPLSKKGTGAKKARKRSGS